MDIYLETERLILRRFTPDDVDELLALHNDPEVMVHLGRRPVTREEIVSETLPRFMDSGEFGFWAAHERGGGDFVGWFHLRPESAEPELGYRLCRAAWGRGYATEGSLALVERAFTRLGAHRVRALTLAANTGSRRVMEKIGMRYVGVVEGFGLPEGLEGEVVEYEIARPA